MPGYEAKFVHPLLKRHECPICLFAMRNPVQTECGHLFCRQCLEPVLKRQRPTCPLDKEEISQEGIFPDNACRREILNLAVHCNYKAGGCPWAGRLKELEDHLQHCEHKDIQCTQCGQYVQMQGLSLHQSKECPMRPVKCVHCGKDVPHQQMEDHIQKKCPDVYHACPNGCDKSLRMKLPELEKHLSPKLGTCPLAEVECPFYSYGCTFASLRQDLPVHMQQYQVYHCQLQADSFKELKQAVDKNASSLQHLLERMGSTESRASALERHQDALEQRVELLDGQQQRARSFDRYDSKLDSLEEQTIRFSAALSDLTRKLDDMQVEAVATSRSSTMPTMSSGYGSSNGGFPLGPGVSGRVGTLGSSSTSSSGQQPPTALTPITTSAAASATMSLGGGVGMVTPQRLDSLNSRLVELEHSVDRSLSSCLDQELRIQLLERATYNGILLWKVDDFERRRREAVEGVTLSLYSTPFYTAHHGYKMCARIYLNGDGLGKGTHMSFFFVIMRGPIDELLPWPFKQKVTLTLLNQAGKRNVTDSFRPDSHSSSFQRPGRREMNIASGCPMFIRQEHLVNGGFVKDDAIYIRVMVDTADLPKVFPST